MANLQQCLLYNSYSNSIPKRNRRKRKNRNKGRKVCEPLNNSIIKQFSWHQVASSSNEQRNVLKPTDTEKPAVNQTIDLCSDDSCSDVPKSLQNVQSNHSVASERKETIIDLSKDVEEVPDQDEIIELTYDRSDFQGAKSPKRVPQPWEYFNDKAHVSKAPVVPKPPVCTASFSRTPVSPAPVNPPSVGRAPVVPIPPVCTASFSRTPVSPAPVNPPSVSRAPVVPIPPVCTDSFSRTPVSPAPVNPPSVSRAPFVPIPSVYTASFSRTPVSPAPVNIPSVSRAPFVPIPSVCTASFSRTPVNQPSVSKAAVVPTPPVCTASFSQASFSKAPVSPASVNRASVSRAPVSPPSVSGAPVSLPSVSGAPVSLPSVNRAPIFPAYVSSPPSTSKETILIDISDDENEGDKLNSKDDTNEEILVIGTFKSTNSNSVVSKKDKNKSPKLSKEEEATLKYIKYLKENPKLYITKLRRRIKAKYFKKLLQYKKNCEVDLLDTIKYQHLLLNNKQHGAEIASKVGENIYINTPVTLPSKGPRPIIIDGSNVAFTSSNGFKFSCKRLDICIRYFKEKGHKVTAFVPQFRLQINQNDDPRLLSELVDKGDVILTPSKVIDGKLVVPYDDRFIVQTAVLKGGIIVTRDNYRDLLEENPSWGETIKYRTLAFTWVDDVLMFPKDPLGSTGPTLEQFLKFG